MNGFRIKSLGLLSILLLAGCASVQIDPEWGSVKQTAQDRTGHGLVWERSEEDRVAIEKEVRQLLADGLAREEAVRIALLNNPALQGRFEEIGISKSELVQAGLFTNPSVGAVFRLLLGGSGTNIEAEGFLPFSDLWQIPFRKKVAEARVQVTLLNVAHMILETAAEARRAFDSAYYLDKAKSETERILERFREISHQVGVRRDFGFMSDQDVYLSQIMVAEAEMELSRFEIELAVARSHLNRILGLGIADWDYSLGGASLPDGLELPSLEEAISRAMAHRLDVQKTRLKIREAERVLQLEKMRVLKHVDVGVSYEREPGGDAVLGPGIDIQLPIFDQNQAKIAKAQYHLRQARKELQALEGRVREEIARDLEMIRFQQGRLKRFRERIIPMREKALAYAKGWVNAMQLNRLFLLEAQKGLLVSRRVYLEARLALQRASVDLELHMGGRRP